MPIERKKVGEVFHFYRKIGVAAIRLTDDGIAIGDTVQIQGPSTSLEQTVETLQIEHADVPRAGPGQEVGMKVRERVREKDFVYKLVPTEAPVRPAPTKEAVVKKAPRRKAPKKKAVRRKAPVRRKASRAPRSKARRGSRRSRPRSR